METETKEKVTHIRIPSELSGRVREFAKANLGFKISASSAVEWALENYVVGDDEIKLDC